MAGDGEQDHHDHGDADHVPPHGYAVENRHEVAREDVDEPMHEQDQREQREDDMGGVVDVRRPGQARRLREVENEVQVVEPQQEVQERRADVVHRGHDGDQADQVEPAREPAPACPAELGGPVVDSARRGHRRGELGHREGHHQDQHADQRPGDRDRDRSAVLQGLPVRREAPGEHRDDRERDREVGETAPSAVQLLLVAKLRKALLVGAH